MLSTHELFHEKQELNYTKTVDYLTRLFIKKIQSTKDRLAKFHRGELEKTREKLTIEH